MHQPDRYCIAIVIIIIIEINNYMVLAHQFNARYSILDTTYPTPYSCVKRVYSTEGYTRVKVTRTY